MRFRSLAAVAALLLAACKDSAGPDGRQLLIISGDSQTVLTADTLDLPLIVRVVDAEGNGVAGVPITWSSGNVTFLTRETTTGPNGTATATMYAGNTPAGGGVLATAGSGDILVGAVDFFVRILDRCDFPTALTIGTSVNGTLARYDCAAIGDGSYLDPYTFVTTGVTRVQFGMTGTFDTYLWVLNGSRVIGVNDDRAPNDTNALISVLLPADDWIVWANSYDTAVVGSYQLQSTAQPEDLADCDRIWIATGLTSTQTLPAAACSLYNLPSTVSDFFPLFVGGGDTIAFTVTAAGFAARAQIFVNGSAASDVTAPGVGQPAVAAFGVPAGAFGSIVLAASSGSGADAGGTYTMTVARSGPNPSPLQPARRRPAARPSLVNLQLR